MAEPVVKKCCKNCGHVTCYKLSRTRYECPFGAVSPNGVCDRFQQNISPTAITRRIDMALKELAKVADGELKITQRPPFGQNYRVQTEEEMRQK